MTKFVADEDRMDWMWNNFGCGNATQSILVENYFYNVMYDSCNNWNGGWFDMREEDNGAKWLCIGSPANKKKFHVVGMQNQYEGDMTGEAFSLGCMILTLNHMVWKYYQTNEKLAMHFNDLFEKIRDFAMDHKEAKEIFRFID